MLQVTGWNGREYQALPSFYGQLDANSGVWDGLDNVSNQPINEFQSVLASLAFEVGFKFGLECGIGFLAQRFEKQLVADGRQKLEVVGRPCQKVVERLEV